jgi:hypothetical protein
LSKLPIRKDIAPGYIAAAAWTRARTWKGPVGDLRTIIQALVLSAVIQAILASLTVAWIVPVRHSLADYPGRVKLWVLLSVIVAPVVLGLAAGWATDALFNPSEDRVRGCFGTLINNIAHAPTTPSIWDWFFTGERVPESGFLVLEFDDGKRIAGAFAR